MVVKIIIDLQEKNTLLKQFGSKNSTGDWEVNDQYKSYMTFGSLNCGDIMFLSDDKPVILIERKHIRDLATCLSTKSYKEQKLRMLKYKSENPQVQLVYLVEEFILQDKSGLDEIVNPSAPTKHQKTNQTILSSIVSTMFRDNFKVMITHSIEGTVAFIERIFVKFPDYEKELANRKEDFNLEYMKNVNVVKKTNITPSNWYMLCLSQIQGMSMDKAKIVASVHPTFQSLLATYNDDNISISQKQNLLTDLKLNNRKLGPVVSKRIFEFVSGRTCENDC